MNLELPCYIYKLTITKKIRKANNVCCEVLVFLATLVVASLVLAGFVCRFLFLLLLIYVRFIIFAGLCDHHDCNDYRFNNNNNNDG